MSSVARKIGEGTIYSFSQNFFGHNFGSGQHYFSDKRAWNLSIRIGGAGYVHRQRHECVFGFWYWRRSDCGCCRQQGVAATQPKPRNF